jgi:hypothetical protein
MSLFQTDEILSKFKLFWQYPVITEKTFYQQNKNNETYIGFPWATIIDKKYNLDVIFKIMKSYVRPNVQYYTCCQHVSFRNLISLFKKLNIHTMYTPHKILTEDQLSDIQLRPCPLYAVNIEDINRNLTFSKCDPLNLNRKLLYSFQGAYHPLWYLTDIRKRIFEMKHPDNCYVNHIGNWHFDNVVYNKLQNSEYTLNESDSDKERTVKYNKLLLDSRYSLCPSGSGPSSIRFWESLAVGSIPVLLADTLELPSHELWDDAIIRIPEDKLKELPTILSTITDEKEREMRVNCIKLYEYYKNNYTNNDKKTIFTSYKCSVDEPIIQSILGKWKLLNPSINVLYFSDDDVDIFFKETDYYDIYKKMKNGVAIADFFRICYINKYGGYWFDLDITPIRLNLPTEGKIHLFDAGYNNISYMFIGGSPNQPLFNEVINIVINNIENNIIKKHNHVMDITGPRVIQNIIFNKLNILNKDGCLVGTNIPKKYLINTDYEFIYSKIELLETKTNEYKILQKKHNKLNYQHYDYI